MADWIDQLRLENKLDEWIKKIRLQVVQQEAQTGFTIRDDLLMYKLRYCVGPDSNLRNLILKELHGSQTGGHAGYLRILHRVRSQVF